MSSLTRLNDSGDQGQSATRVMFPQPRDETLTAVSVSSTSSELRLTKWAFTSAGAVTRGDVVTSSRAMSQFDAALMSTCVAVAYRDASTGALHVLTFDGNVAHGVARAAIDDRRLAVVRLSITGQFFVAFANTGGDLRVELWGLTGTDDTTPTFMSGSGDQAGASSHIAAAWAGRATRLVTAVRTGGNLKLINWGLDGQSHVQRLGDSGSQAGAVEDLCICGFQPLDDVAGFFVVTAVKNGSGNLEIISWRVNDDGSITRIASHTSGAAGELAITSFDAITTATKGLFATAITNGGGNLEVTTWRLLADGSIQRLASATAGAASHVSIVESSPDMVATTCLTGSGIERVITWRLA